MSFVQPLNSLLLLAESMSENEEGNMTESQVESARVIYDSGNELLSLINEILDLSKIEAGRMELDMGKVIVEDIAGRINESFGHMARAKGLEFKVEIDEKTPVELITDSKRMEQILRNLISNAIKFTETGEVIVRFGPADNDSNLSRSGIKPSDCIAVSVRDTGIGIPADKRKIIFEAFQQVEGGASRRFGGTGLGLSISRELASLLGGEIQMESEEGAGSMFTLFLPLDSRKTQSARKTVEGEELRRSLWPESKKKSLNAREKIAVSGDSEMPKGPPSIPDDRDDITEGDRVILVIEDDIKFAGLLKKECK